MTSSLPFIEVVCALMEESTEKGITVWVAQRKDEYHAGQWEFPGGKVEANELPGEALIREIREELDCSVQILEELPHHDHDYGQGRRIRLMPFRCRMLSRPTTREHTALRQVTVDECDSLLWVEADRPIVANWQRLIRQSSDLRFSPELAQ